LPRPKLVRKIGYIPTVTYFKPRGVPVRQLQEVIIGFDELEALRLSDFEGLYHDRAAKIVGVSRQTLGRMLEEVRKKVVDALINGKALKIECNPSTKILAQFVCNKCDYVWQGTFEVKKPSCCPSCKDTRCSYVNG